MPKGMNVKSNLLELKNLSEVILDLAYSSIFLEDKELADYVKELYEEIIELEIRTIEILFKVKGMKDTKIAVIKLMDKGH